MAESPTRQPTIALGPLTLVAAAALWRGLSRRRPLTAVLGLAAAAAELAWPRYQRFKRRRLVPKLLAYYPDR